MRTAKAVLALFVSGSLALPASAQVRAAASVAGSALPRVSLAAPLAPSPTAFSAPVLTLSAAPALLPSAFAALAAPASAAPPAASAAEAAPAALPADGEALPASAAAPAPESAAPAERAGGLSCPDSAASPAASARARWESFWSGAASRRGAEADAPPVAAEADGVSPRSALAPARRSSSSAPARVAAAAAVLVPAARGFHAFLSHATPFLGAGGVLVGAYFANRGLHALLNRFAAKKGLDRQKLAAVRLVASVALWTGAAAGALIVGGAPHATLTAVLGTGGTILTLGLRDALGNVIQGVNFLLTRPFAIGARVQIDDQIGTVSDVTLTNVVLAKDDGSEVKIRHATLSSKPVIVFGPYVPESELPLAVPARPKFKGAASAVVKSLDRRFWLAGAAFAALLAVPHFVPLLAAGWAATTVHYALAGAIAWFTRRVDRALGSAVDLVAGENAWRPETKAIARLAVGAALWATGGGAALRLIGVTWTALGASLGLTGLGIGLASNNFFGSVVTGGEVLFSKPFKVGDQISAGGLSGVVEDMTLSNVVLKLDSGRHALVPYAVVRDATLVVTPEQIVTPTK